MRTYTFGQCARLLAIDPKVFRQWVKEDLALQKGDQVSRADRRTRYLTREQLERLAELEAQHRRQLAEVEAGYQHQIAELEAQLALYRRGQHPESTSPTATKKKARTRLKELPKTLASRHAFAALHHIPDSVVARA